MTTEFKIRKNVKMPRRREDGGYGFKYPFPDMEVGDSFVVKNRSKKALESAAAAARAYGARNGKKFSHRTIGKNEIGIWRVK